MLSQEVSSNIFFSLWLWRDLGLNPVLQCVMHKNAEEYKKSNKTQSVRIFKNKVKRLQKPVVAGFIWVLQCIEHTHTHTDTSNTINDIPWGVPVTKWLTSILVGDFKELYNHDLLTTFLTFPTEYYAHHTVIGPSSTTRGDCALYIYIYIYTPNPSGRWDCDTSSLFNWFEFRVFLLLDWLPYRG